MSGSQLRPGRIEPELSDGSVDILVRRPTEDNRVHMVFPMRRHIVMEIIHKVLPLHALITPITNLSGKELDNASKRRYREERADPRIIYLGL